MFRIEVENDTDGTKQNVIDRDTDEQKKRGRYDRKPIKIHKKHNRYDTDELLIEDKSIR